MRLTQLEQQASGFIWSQNESATPWWVRQLRVFLQILLLIIRDLRQGMLTLRAMSLVYTTLLSLVPLLAVSFSVLKGFGVHNQVQPLLLNLFAPLGEQGIDVANRIVGFVENMKIGVLGGLGMVMLLYTVIALLQKIEGAFNHTWRLRNSRNLAQRFSHYLSTLTVGPVLVFSAIGMTASLSHSEWLAALTQWSWMGYVIAWIGKILPYIFIILAFSFLYILIPNVRVKVGSALYGAVIAGIMWDTTGRVFASFASGSTNYTAIYSGFAILLLFMIWLYIGWLILLIGASISYYHQNPSNRQLASEQSSLSARQQEWLTLQIMAQVAQHHLNPNLPQVTLSDLAAQFGVRDFLLQPLLEHLQHAGLLTTSCEYQGAYVPARYIDNIPMVELVQLARRIGETGTGLSSSMPLAQQQDAFAEWETVVEQAWSELSLKQWVDTLPQSG